MKLNKIIAIIVLLLFALGTFAPIAFAATLESYQIKLEDLGFQYIELQDQYNLDIYSVIEFSVTKDAEDARNKLHSIENKLWSIENGVYQVRGDLLYEVSEGTFQVGDGSEKDDLLNQVNAFIGELTFTQGVFWKSEDALDMMVTYEKASKVYETASVDLDRSTGLQVQIEDLIYQKGSASLVESKFHLMDSVVKSVEDAKNDLQFAQMSNELLQKEFTDKFNILIIDFDNLLGNTIGMGEYAYAYILIYDLAPKELTDLKAKHTKLAAEENTLLCDKKDTSTVKIALNSVKSDINEGMNYLYGASYTAFNNYNAYLESDADELIGDYNAFLKEIDSTLAKVVGTDCNPNTPTPKTPTPTVKDEWVEFTELEDD